LVERLSELGDIGLSDPIRSIGVLIDFAAEKAKREVRPDRVRNAHPELSKHADSLSDQVKRLLMSTATG